MPSEDSCAPPSCEGGASVCLSVCRARYELRDRSAGGTVLRELHEVRATDRPRGREWAVLFGVCVAFGVDGWDALCVRRVESVECGAGVRVCACVCVCVSRVCSAWEGSPSFCPLPGVAQVPTAALPPENGVTVTMTVRSPTDNNLAAVSGRAGWERPWCRSVRCTLCRPALSLSGPV